MTIHNIIYEITSGEKESKDYKGRKETKDCKREKEIKSSLNLEYNLILI